MQKNKTKWKANNIKFRSLHLLSLRRKYSIDDSFYISRSCMGESFYFFFSSSRSFCIDFFLNWWLLLFQKLWEKRKEGNMKKWGLYKICLGWWRFSFQYVISNLQCILWQRLLLTDKFSTLDMCFWKYRKEKIIYLLFCKCYKYDVIVLILYILRHALKFYISTWFLVP